MTGSRWRDFRIVVAAACCVRVRCGSAVPWRRIACVGDSVTRGDTLHEDEPDQGKEDRGNYPSVLEGLLGGDGEVAVSNFGASGASVQGKRAYDGTGAYDDAVAFDPDCVVVLLGVNDAKLDFDASDFAEAYAELVRRLLDDARGVEAIFVATPYRVIGTCCDIDIDLVNERIPDGVVAFVEGLAPTEVGVPVTLVDLRPGWLSGTSCDEDDVDDGCESFYDGDGMHTSAKGSELLATLVYEALLVGAASAPSYAPSTYAPTSRSPTTYRPSYAPSASPEAAPSRRPTAVPAAVVGTAAPSASPTNARTWRLARPGSDEAIPEVADAAASTGLPSSSPSAAPSAALARGGALAISVVDVQAAPTSAPTSAARGDGGGASANAAGISAAALIFLALAGGLFAGGAVVFRARLRLGQRKLYKSTDRPERREAPDSPFASGWRGEGHAVPLRSGLVLTILPMSPPPHGGPDGLELEAVGRSPTPVRGRVVSEAPGGYIAKDLTSVCDEIGDRAATVVTPTQDDHKRPAAPSPRPPGRSASVTIDDDGTFLAYAKL